MPGAPRALHFPMCCDGQVRGVPTDVVGASTVAAARNLHPSREPEAADRAGGVHIAKFHTPEIIIGRGSLAEVPRAAAGLGTVSYTHLTLPTKRIV